MNNKIQYTYYSKPHWAPPNTLFAPVWSILYGIIAVSYTYVVIAFAKGAVPLIVLLPFLLNLFFNLLYTPIQFKLKNMTLATVDILLVAATLVWALFAIHKYTAWVAYVNIPYLLWVLFATTLQITILVMNQ